MAKETKPVVASAKPESVELDEELTKAETVLITGPAMIVSRLGFGGVLGFCSGYAIKQASKALAVVVGSAVVLLQSMQYFGYIEVKWDKIQKDTMRSLSSDGQESFGVKDVKYWTRKMMRILTHQGPTAGGFAAGIYIGLGM
jgi:FUN14 domain-containing protein 1